jgi:hypothetical protein
VVELEERRAPTSGHQNLGSSLMPADPLFEAHWKLNNFTYSEFVTESYGFTAAVKM